MAEEDVVNRVMPHSAAAEQSVIGAMIMDSDAIGIATEMLIAQDFYSRQNQMYFTAIVSMSQAQMDVDPVTLQTKLTEMNLPPEACSAEAIREYLVQVPTSANVRSYCTIVQEDSLLRSMIRAAGKISEECYNPEGRELEQVFDDAEKEVFAVTQRRKVSDFVPISRVVIDAMDRIVRASRIRGNVTGLATGFTDMDNQLAGLQPADFILIAARPSMGKTALALNIAEHMVMKDHRCVAIFSLEMSKEQLTNRLFSMESHVDAQKIRTGDMSEQEWADLIESAGLIGESRLIIDDTPAITVAEMRSKCRKYKMEYGLEAVMIDYLQLMGGSGKGTDSRQQEISEISRSLKALARELNVPVIALSQLSRAVEGRPNHRPMLSDLRESGAIEQDADVVMFIYRDDYYHPDTEDKGIAEVNIAKQRNGPIGVVRLKWQPELTRFANLEGGGRRGPQ